MTDSHNAVVLVVDDVPDTLSLLHDALVEAGYTVLVASNGEKALKITKKVLPDIILLDAVMPDMNGFDVCRALKKDINTRHVPIIFMTGLTESENVVEGFAAGGIDYVTKPLRPIEVIVRLNTHLKNSRVLDQTKGALDAFGQAAMAVLPQTSTIVWQTPLARELLQRYSVHSESVTATLPADFDNWISQLSQQGKKRLQSYTLQRPNGRLIITPSDINNDEQWLLILREESETAQIEALKALFKLTKRESEVLHWINLGKTDKSIAEILGMSPRTVSKHTEHIFIKLGVETRTAAAAIASNKLHAVRG